MSAVWRDKKSERKIQEMDTCDSYATSKWPLASKFALNAMLACQASAHPHGCSAAQTTVFRPAKRAHLMRAYEQQ